MYVVSHANLIGPPTSPHRLRWLNGEVRGRCVLLSLQIPQGFYVKRKFHMLHKLAPYDAFIPSF